MSGVADEFRNNFIAHGFIVVDANGNALPRIIMPKILVPTACTSGLRRHAFPATTSTTSAQVQLQEIPGAPTSASEIWGLVDLDDNREYAILGHRNGTAFYDVTTPGTPVLVGNIPGNPSLWREVKAYQILRCRARPASRLCLRDHRSAGRRPADHRSHQSADQRLARQHADASSAPRTRCTSPTSTTPPTRALPGATPYLFIAGANIAGGAYRIYDLTNPVAPTLVTAPPAGTGYMHDSTSMLITDNRTTQCANAHNPCEVLVDFNETSVDLWDVTDKAAPVRLSTTTYPTASYVHSGWPTADNMAIVVHDELDELRRGLNTHIYTLDIARPAHAEPGHFVHRRHDVHGSQRLHDRQSLLRLALQARPGDLRRHQSARAHRDRLVRHVFVAHRPIPRAPMAPGASIHS